MGSVSIGLALDQGQGQVSAAAPRRITLDGPLIIRGSARTPEGQTP